MLKTQLFENAICKGCINYYPNGNIEFYGQLVHRNSSGEVDYKTSIPPQYKVKLPEPENTDIYPSIVTFSEPPYIDFNPNKNPFAPPEPKLSYQYNSNNGTVKILAGEFKFTLSFNHSSPKPLYFNKDKPNPLEIKPINLYLTIRLIGKNPFEFEIQIDSGFPFKKAGYMEPWDVFTINTDEKLNKMEYNMLNSNTQKKKSNLASSSNFYNGYDDELVHDHEYYENRTKYMKQQQEKERRRSYDRIDLPDLSSSYLPTAFNNQVRTPSPLRRSKLNIQYNFRDFDKSLIYGDFKF